MSYDVQINNGFQVFNTWPLFVKSHFHPQHKLVRTSREAYTCDGCNGEGTQFSFYCSYCDFDLHPQCAQQTTELGFQQQQQSMTWTNQQQQLPQVQVNPETRPSNYQARAGKKSQQKRKKKKKVKQESAVTEREEPNEPNQEEYIGHDLEDIIEEVFSTRDEEYEKLYQEVYGVVNSNAREEEYQRLSEEVHGVVYSQPSSTVEDAEIARIRQKKKSQQKKKKKKNVINQESAVTETEESNKPNSSAAENTADDDSASAEIKAVEEARRMEQQHYHNMMVSQIMMKGHIMRMQCMRF